jgi:hypothetical protein
METVVRITRGVAGNRLADVPDDVAFSCYDGKILRNLGELENALTGMEEETFSHHVTESKNDFSRWVRDIISDEKLAKDLEKSSSRGQAAKAVSSRIAFLESKLV